MAKISKGKDTFSIAAGSTATAAIDLNGRDWFGVYVPALGTTATVTITASVDGTNFAALRDVSDNQIGVWATSTAARVLDGDSLARFFPYRWIKITLSAAQTSITDIVVGFGAF